MDDKTRERINARARELAAEAPPLSGEQIVKLRALFGFPALPRKEPVMEIGWWVCGQFHVFQFGQLGWHMESWANSGFDHGCLVPVVCQAEGCMDSEHLWGPWDNEDTADLVATAKKASVGGRKLTGAEHARLGVALEAINSRLTPDDMILGPPAGLHTISQAHVISSLTPDSPSWHGRNSTVTAVGREGRGEVYKDGTV